MCVCVYFPKTLLPKGTFLSLQALVKLCVENCNTLEKVIIFTAH